MRFSSLFTFRRIAVVGLASASLVALSGFGSRFHRGMDPAEAKAFVLERLDDKLDDLDATDPQKKEIAALAEALFPDAEQLHAQNRLARKELIAQVKAGKLDPARLHQLVDERSASFTAFAHKVVDQAAKADGVLNAEQHKQLAERAEKLEKRFEK